MKTDKITKFFLVACWMLLGGFAFASDMVVSIDMAQAGLEVQGETRRAKLVVIDLRRESNLERTTIGGMSMGKIALTPAVTDIVRQVIEAKMYTVLAGEVSDDQLTVYCGIRAFDITTPATLLYWDINAKIEIILRARKQDRTVSILATERTYVWPSETLIQRVTMEAVSSFSVEAERALSDLLKQHR